MLMFNLNYGMRHKVLLPILLILVWLFCYNQVVTAAATYPDLPKNNNFIVDAAHVINKNDANKINTISSSLWKEKKIPLIIVSIKSLSSMEAYQSIEKYTQGLFDYWRLGLTDRNYGIILLISIADRKSRIEFGAGWDHRYDSQAIRITKDYLIPQFRTGNYSKGLLAGTQALNNLARGLALPEIKQPWWIIPLTIAIAILLVLIIRSLFKSGRKGWAWALIIFIGIALWWMMRNSGSMSGGGSSGGGGATGSW